MSKKDMRTTAAGQDKILRLRAAIFDDSGADRNVLLDFAPFAKYEKNGLDLVIEFRTGTKLGEEVSDWAFELVKKHMEEEYDNSGYRLRPLIYFRGFGSGSNCTPQRLISR